MAKLKSFHLRRSQRDATRFDPIFVRQPPPHSPTLTLSRLRRLALKHDRKSYNATFLRRTRSGRPGFPKFISPPLPDVLDIQNQEFLFPTHARSQVVCRLLSAEGTEAFRGRLFDKTLLYNLSINLAAMITAINSSLEYMPCLTTFAILDSQQRVDEIIFSPAPHGSKPEKIAWLATRRKAFPEELDLQMKKWEELRTEQKGLEGAVTVTRRRERRVGEIQRICAEWSPDHCAEGELISPLARLAIQHRVKRGKRIECLAVRIKRDRLLILPFYGNCRIGSRWLENLGWGEINDLGARTGGKVLAKYQQDRWKPAW